MLTDPLAVDLRARIAEAYPWLRALGNRAIESPLGRFVVNPETPDVWDANHLQEPRADAAAELAPARRWTLRRWMTKRPGRSFIGSCASTTKRGAGPIT